MTLGAHGRRVLAADEGLRAHLCCVSTELGLAHEVGESVFFVLAAVEAAKVGAYSAYTTTKAAKVLLVQLANERGVVGAVGT